MTYLRMRPATMVDPWVFPVRSRGAGELGIARQEGTVTPMLLPPDYHTLMAMGLNPPAKRPRHQGSGRLATHRERARSWRIRTALGRTCGDHALGESQWAPASGSYPATLSPSLMAR